jgi:hypothetical protein
MNAKIRSFYFSVFAVIYFISSLQFINGQDYDIPDNRRIPWLAGSDQWNRGSFPNYTQVTCTGLMEGNGTTDNGQAIQSFINSSAANTAVFIPAGIYYVNSNISLKNNIILRGAKPSEKPYMPFADATATTFKFGPNGQITIGSTENVGPAIALSGGYTKGSQLLVASTNPGVAVNDWIAVIENGDPNIPTTIKGDIGNCTWCGGPRQNGQGTELIQQFAQVISVNGNTIRISRPLYWTFLPDQSPCIKKMTFNIKYAGLENIRLNGDYADHGAFISMEGALFSWVKGVETYNAGSGAKAAHVVLKFSHGCEIRDSYFHKGRDGSGDRNYGIALFFWNSDHKLENNILRQHRHSLCFEGGGEGIVALYNYVDDNYTDDLSYLGSARLNHGAHPMMNLFEGNAISHMIADNYWGSSSHFTLFRNHFWGDESGTDVPAKPEWGFTPLEIWKNQNYYSLVGNILGISGKWGNPNWSSYTGYRNTNCSGDKPMVSFGCNSNDTTFDSKASSSSLNHGNYDLKTKGVAYWEGGTNHKLKSSMYYSSKPSWWCNQTPWPAIGPDVSGFYDSIPSQIRYFGGLCDNPTAQNDIATPINNFAIYPNTFNENTAIDFGNTKNSAANNLNFHLHNLLGKEVAIINNISTNKFIFEEKNLAEGMNLYRVMMKEENIGSGKLIVQ